MKTIRIAYAQMWGEASWFPADYIAECFPFLRPHYQFELSDKPEFVFTSVYGYVGNRYEGAKRIVYAGEPGDHFTLGGKVSPGQWEPGFYHYGITCSANETSPNHRYMPQGLLHLNLYNQGMGTLVRDGGPAPEKKHFCNFIYSNGCSRDRIDFFHKLGKYKRIESCGHVERNNQALASAAYSRDGYLLKQAFQAQCKFSIAMENTYFPGYSTEKLTDPFVARSVPIYRGDPQVASVFNPDAFINLSDFASNQEAIDYIEAVDLDPKLYEFHLNAPPFRDNVVPRELSEAHYLEFFQSIFDASR
jgi:hypothetical protein